MAQMDQINCYAQQIPKPNREKWRHFSLFFFPELSTHLGFFIFIAQYPKPSILVAPILFSGSSLFSVIAIFPPFDRMKKARKGLAMDSETGALFERSKIGIKHRRLLEDYEELQNETEARTEKLLIANRKKSSLLAEVRFLRQRYEFLKNQPTLPKVALELPRNLEIRPPITKKEKRSRNREASLKPLDQAYDLNQRRAIYNGMEATSQKSQHINQVTTHNYFPIFDKKETVHREHEVAANRDITPVFDLNQISREEEEMQAGFEPLRAEEEPRNLFVRTEHDAMNADLTISSICRNSNGSNRAGKRKISWQDQVALRA